MTYFHSLFRTSPCLAGFLGIVFYLSSTTSAHAVSVFADLFFDQRSAWEAAVLASDPAASFTTDSFENNISNGLSITFDSGVKSVASNVPNDFNQTGFNFVEHFATGRYLGSVDATSSGGAQFIDWTFPSPIFAFGADFTNLSIRNLQITGDFDGTGPITLNPAAEFGVDRAGGFFGVVGLSNFVQIRWSDPSLVPASWALLVQMR